MANNSLKIKVDWNTAPLRHFARSIEDDSPEMRNVFRAWHHRYGQDMTQRYSRFARGGGDWKPLAEETKKRKFKKSPRKGYKGPRYTGILQDTGQLMAALATGHPGNYMRGIRHGIEYGLAARKHDLTSGLSYRELMLIHHEGQGKVPARPILVEPSQEALADMAKMLSSGLADLGRKAEREGG